MSGRILWADDGGAAPTPCPATRIPSVIGDSGTVVKIRNTDPPVGFIKPADLMTYVNPEGNEFPPCVAPNLTTPPLDDWDYKLTDTSGTPGVELPIVLADTNYNGLLTLYEAGGCGELGARTVQVWIETPAGNDFSTVTFDLLDIDGVCPA